MTEEALRMTKGGAEEDVRFSRHSEAAGRRIRPQQRPLIRRRSPPPSPLRGKVLGPPRSGVWDRADTEGRGRPGDKAGVQLWPAGRHWVRRDANGKRIHHKLWSVSVAGGGRLSAGGVQPGQRKNRRRPEGGGGTGGGKSPGGRDQGRPGPQRPGGPELQRLQPDPAKRLRRQVHRV